MDPAFTPLNPASPCLADCSLLRNPLHFSNLRLNGAHAPKAKVVGSNPARATIYSVDMSRFNSLGLIESRPVARHESLCAQMAGKPTPSQEKRVGRADFKQRVGGFLASTCHNVRYRMFNARLFYLFVSLHLPQDIGASSRAIRAKRIPIEMLKASDT